VYGEARKWMLATAKKLGWGDTINGSWTCKDPEGRVELLTVRFEGGRRPKNVITFWWDGERVQCRNPPVRLFGRDALAQRPEDPVCIHEGEKCWAAAQAIPGYVAVTWNGGAKKAKQVDWSALAGRAVTILPDDDPPGRDTAFYLAKVLQGIAASVRIVAPLEEARAIKSKGADIVEALQVRSAQGMADYLRTGPELEDQRDSATDRDEARHDRVSASDEQAGAGGNNGAGDSLSQDNFPFRILGTADDGLTYFLDRSERLQALRLGALSKTQLQLLAPLEWWIAHFRGSRGKLDVDEAVDYVIEAANGKGFDLANLIGRGAWRDPRGLVYHDGEKTYGNPDSAFIYQKKARLDMGLDGDPATPDTRAGMFAAASQMSFETPADCARLLAWSVLAPFCGALPWRPAGFVTGGSGTGKSTVLTMVVKKLARPLCASGSSTEAGIRQAAGNDCLGIEIDEAEAHDENDQRNVRGLFGLMRQSTSDDAPPILKGTTTGKGMSFASRCMYLFSAITPGFERQADFNRFFVVDLVPPTNDWKKVRAEVEAAFTDANCAAVRAYVWPRLTEIMSAARGMVDAIREASRFDDRYALLEGMLWAAHWLVWKSRLPAGAELAEWLAMVYSVKAPQAVEDDAVTMMRRLLAEVVQLQDNPGKRFTMEHMALALATGYEEQATEGQSGVTCVDGDKYRRTLGLYGLYVPTRGEYSGCLAVQVNHPWIARTIATGSQYAKTLARHPLCIAKTKPVTPTGDTSRRCMIFSPLVLGGEG
jgi:putative DNA primase/helicase